VSSAVPATLVVATTLMCALVGRASFTRQARRDATKRRASAFIAGLRDLKDVQDRREPTVRKQSIRWVAIMVGLVEPDSVE
jgi:hypothetical protein